MPERVAQVHDQVEATGNLRRLGCSGGRSLAENIPAITGDPLDVRPAMQPGGDRSSFPIRQQADDAAGLQIADQSAVPQSLTVGPIVHAHSSRTRVAIRRGLTELTQHGITADIDANPRSQPPSQLTAASMADSSDELRKSRGLTVVRSGNIRAAFCEHLPWTDWITAEKATHVPLQQHLSAFPW
jgi:hypothetical protein